VLKVNCTLRFRSCMSYFSKYKSHEGIIQKSCSPYSDMETYFMFNIICMQSRFYSWPIRSCQPQALSNCVLTKEDRVHFDGSYEICGGQSGTRVGFLRALSFPSIHHYMIAPYSSIISGWDNGPNWGPFEGLCFDPLLQVKISLLDLKRTTDSGWFLAWLIIRPWRLRQ
jgi:hypothetical protein